jgi:hypothetical protein
MAVIGNETELWFMCFASLVVNIPMVLKNPVVLYGCETWSLTLREERFEGIW